MRPILELREQIRKELAEEASRNAANAIIGAASPLTLTTLALEVLTSSECNQHPTQSQDEAMRLLFDTLSANVGECAAIRAICIAYLNDRA